MYPYYSTKDIKTVDIFNPYTGENETHELHKQKKKKPTAKRGWQMTYVKDRNEVILNLKGTKKLEIFFWIENQFKKSTSTVPLNQTKLAKRFDTTQQYVGSVLKLLTEMNYLVQVEKGSYKMNPFMIVPFAADATELQKEWLLLISKTIRTNEIDDLNKYALYLESPEWKNKAQACKDRDVNCKLCGSASKLQAHHITYDNLYNEKLEDLITLCFECHSNQHHK